MLHIGDTVCSIYADDTNRLLYIVLHFATHNKDTAVWLHCKKTGLTTILHIDDIKKVD